MMAPASVATEDLQLAAEAPTPVAWQRRLKVKLAAEQARRFVELWDEINDRYPDDRNLREAARVGAAYYLAGYMTPAGISGELEAARKRADEMLAVARAVATLAVNDGQPEAEVARSVGVDRMALRKWLGKR